mgnify:CR=1 FL=1
MKDTQAALIVFLKKNLPKLKQNYKWAIPEVPASTQNLAGRVDYNSTIALKQELHKKWKSFDDDETHFQIAQSIVAHWGGVKGNKESTLRKYIENFKKDSFETPLKGVASYSKILAIIDPEKYAIYDARVAVALNAIQVNRNVVNGTAFNYVPGRNNITGNVTSRIGFAYDERFKVASLVEKGWQRIKRDDTYEIYLNLLKSCLDILPDYSLFDLEMALFSNAEQEAKKAIDS